MLNKLASNEAVLLMYLAGELPAEDRAEVEHMLAGDGALRAQLESLKQLSEGIERSVRVGEGDWASAAEQGAIQRTVREMRRHRLEQMARPAVAAPARRRWPAWAYPVASAAAAVFLAIGLWGIGVIDFGPELTTGAGDVRIGLDDDGLDGDALVEGWPFGPVGGPALDEASRHAMELQRDETDDGLLLML